MPLILFAQKATMRLRGIFRKNRKQNKKKVKVCLDDNYGELNVLHEIKNSQIYPLI